MIQSYSVFAAIVNLLQPIVARILPFSARKAEFKKNVPPIL